MIKILLVLFSMTALLGCHLEDDYFFDGAVVQHEQDRLPPNYHGKNSANEKRLPPNHHGKNHGGHRTSSANNYHGKGSPNHLTVKPRLDLNTHGKKIDV